MHCERYHIHTLHILGYITKYFYIRMCVRVIRNVSVNVAQTSQILESSAFLINIYIYIHQMRELMMRFA